MLLKHAGSERDLISQKINRHTNTARLILRKNLTLRDINTTETDKAGFATVDSCFALTGARQHGVESKSETVANPALSVSVVLMSRKVKFFRSISLAVFVCQIRSLSDPTCFSSIIVRGPLHFSVLISMLITS